MMANLIQTGIIELDRALGGGIPEGTLTLAYGGPGVGKSLLGMQFLKAGLHSGETCAYHLFDRPYPWLVRYCEVLGLDAKTALEEGRLWVLQSFPHFFPFPKPKGVAYFPYVQLDEVREYFAEKTPKRLVVGDLCASTLGLFSGRELGEWLAWMNNLAFFGGTNVLILLSGQEGPQEYEKFRQVLEKYAQNVFAFRQIEEKREMRLVKVEGLAHPMDWMNIGITLSGIKIKS